LAAKVEVSARVLHADRAHGGSGDELFRATMEGDVIRVSKYRGERKFYWEESEGYVFKQTPHYTSVSWSHVTIDPNDLSHASTRNIEIATVKREYYDEVKERIIGINTEKDQVARANETIKLVKEIFAEYELTGK
jgi:hypothetical protein